MGTNSTHEQPPEEQEAYCFLVAFFFVVVLALAFLAVAGFFFGAFADLVVTFLEAFADLVVTFLVDALAVADFFTFLAVVFFAVVFFLDAADFLTGFFALGLAVMAFLASADILYEALTFTRSPSATPLARAAFITCFLISFCKCNGLGLTCGVRGGLSK